MAGGKGVNIARTLKALGQPVIATGFAGGATGTHIVEQLTEESILNDFVRIREESRTNTSVLDPTTGQQTEINERGPAVSDARGRAVPRQARVPRARRRDRRVRRIAAARGRAGPVRVARAGARAPRRAHGRGHRRRAAAPGGARRARPRLARTCSRPRSSSATSSPARRSARRRSPRSGRSGSREAIMTLPDGCFAQLLIDGQRLVKRARVEHARADRQDRLRRRLPGRLSRRALRRARARPVPALRRRLRRRVHRAPGRRADRRRARPAA